MNKIACGYAIATLRTNNGPMLVAVVPDGDDIEAAISEEEERAGVAFDRRALRSYGEGQGEEDGTQR